MHINVVVIGHVDSGKSTTTGRKPSLSERPRGHTTYNWLQT
jgi:translation elongation factor EF-Tu-like GTPase